MADPTEPFELPIQVAPDDIDELGHVNNVTYLRWVQDAAVAHWTAAAPAAEQARLFWIVLRHEIDYLHPAHFDDGRVLARARTVWCPNDATTRKPTPVSAELRARFSVPATSPE